MKSIARWLRDIAEYIDPQPFSIELLEVEEPIVEHLNRDLRGFPVYFWKNDHGFEMWPLPDTENYKIAVRAS